MSTGHLITMLYVHGILLLLNTFELFIGGANVSRALCNYTRRFRLFCLFNFRNLKAEKKTALIPFFFFIETLPTDEVVSNPEMHPPIALECRFILKCIRHPEVVNPVLLARRDFLYI